MSASQEQPRANVLSAAVGLAPRDRQARLARVVERYFRHVPTEDLLARQPEDLLGTVVQHEDLARERPVGSANVAVINPAVEAQGWSCRHTVVQIVTDDMPFLVDSMTMALAQLGRDIHLLVHPVMVVRRDAAGVLHEVLDVDPGQSVDGFGVAAESWIHLEVDRLGSAPERDDVAARLRSVLADVRDSVEDWDRMHRRCTDLADHLHQSPPPGIPEAEVSSTTRFLQWLTDNHFTFLGYREYALVRREDHDALQAVRGTGLGLLRYDRDESVSFARLSREVQAHARDRELLVLTKANSRATVHRPVYLDYVGVKVFDEAGEVVGERRFLGLFAAAAYTASVLDIPIVAERVREVIDRSGYGRDSHSAKDLLAVLENYPRDELFQTPVADLLRIALAVVHLHERIRPRVFLRRDVYGRFMSALVYLPRDRYTTPVRLRIEAVLRTAFDAASVEYTTRVTESPLARIHYVLRVAPGEAVPDLDPMALERQVADATRSWEEDLETAIRSEHGEEEGARLAGLYAKSFPEAYKEHFHPRMAVADLRHVEDLTNGVDFAFNMYQEPATPATERRFKLYRRSLLSLTEILPHFTNMGVEVIDERPYEVTRADGASFHIYDFGLRVSDPQKWGSSEDREDRRTSFQETVEAVWRGRAESDRFNALVLAAGLTWRQVVVLRAVSKYLRQGQSLYSQDYVISALLAQAELARLLVDLFETRFDPHRYDGLPGTERTAASERLTGQIEAGLDDVSSLDHDRILRALLGVILAVLRTNHYQRDDAGRHRECLALKLDPTRVPQLPAPRPMFEIWVYSPRVEGVHLRFGRVARGGLRWSDRMEDFRTEILGLVKAQMVKNAVIVPTGSKGGFVPKRLPDPANRDAWLAEGIAAYELFISGMLDVTDNRVGTQIVAPTGVVRHDGDDPYLVVAADKGTATFSDIANAQAARYGYWLDDAFASGGSAGYDHKAIGITARGAWESVKRHFRELGVDIQSQETTVVGIGDMSGDVFGNGMLLSRHLRLVAAFDHRHVFLDPDPDPESTFAERSRLFQLPRSSWADYDTTLLSPGGGVYPRTAKAIRVSPQAVEALGLPAGTRSMTPADLIRAILQAPVDLLWNGGIGTYVKASSEMHSEVGDRANDGIRVDGRQLRCRVVGEGGNLGCTQLGRIEAAVTGVRVNTDAWDNSAGVDTSDHEVNIKILLGALVRSGDLTIKQRNKLLVSMTDEVAEQVLRDNYEQNVLLGTARSHDAEMAHVHQRLIRAMEQEGDLDRSLEFLPSDAVLRSRRAEGRGLTSPELCVVAAYVKLGLKSDLLATSLSDDPWFVTTLGEYFPRPIRERYARELADHPLRREIVTNAVVNSMVNRGGMTFAHRAVEETGRDLADVARAFVVCREVFDLASFAAEVEALDAVVPTDVQDRLYLAFRRLLDRGTRWFLQTRPDGIDVAAEIARFTPWVAQFTPLLPQLVQGREREQLERAAEALQEQQVPEHLAVRAASLLHCYGFLDVVETAEETDAAADDVLAVQLLLSEHFGVDALLTRVSRLPRTDRWDGLARAAVRDDLYALLDGLTRAVLAASDSDATPGDRVAEWLSANELAQQRSRAAVASVERLENPSLAAVSVALRVLRGMLRRG